MTANEYQQLSQRTVPSNYPRMERMLQYQPEKDILHALLGISSESGELADCIKKFLCYNQPLDYDNIIEECGDLLWYIALMLSRCGVTMEECMQQNIDKLKKRYPEKFTEKNAIERKDKNET